MPVNVIDTPTYAVLLCYAIASDGDRVFDIPHLHLFDITHK